MSGVFMDGGGHDHGGHAMHGHGGDGGGGNLMDGGNNDHGHHGHAFHHNGGDGNFLSNLLGYNDHSGHHSFLSHLLGLDHDAHHGGHGVGHTGGEGMAPSQTPIWTSALQGIKLEHAFEGVNISINVWFAIFYILCIFWLFCIYWIRHNEHLANGVLGRGAAKYETAAADRRIIDNSRDAAPIRTSAGQSYYAPMPATFVDPAAKAAIKAAAFDPAKAQMMETPSWSAPQVTPMPATSSIQFPGTTPAAVPTANAGISQMASYYTQATPYGVPTSAMPGAAPQMSTGATHMVASPMPMSPGAQRLKMIINK